MEVFLKKFLTLSLIYRGGYYAMRIYGKSIMG